MVKVVQKNLYILVEHLYHSLLDFRVFEVFVFGANLGVLQISLQHLSVVGHHPIFEDGVRLIKLAFNSELAYFLITHLDCIVSGLHFDLHCI